MNKKGNSRPWTEYVNNKEVLWKRNVYIYSKTEYNTVEISTTDNEKRGISGYVIRLIY